MRQSTTAARERLIKSLDSDYDVSLRDNCCKYEQYRLLDEYYTVDHERAIIQITAVVTNQLAQAH